MSWNLGARNLSPGIFENIPRNVLKNSGIGMECVPSSEHRNVLQNSWGQIPGPGFQDTLHSYSGMFKTFLGMFWKIPGNKFLAPEFQDTFNSYSGMFQNIPRNVLKNSWGRIPGPRIPGHIPFLFRDVSKHS